MLIGVNSGYNADSAITESEEAQHMIAGKLEEFQRILPDFQEYQIFPGVAIYRQEWGCPVGGEPVAAVTTNGNIECTLRMVEGLREAFNQSTVTVVCPTDKNGTSVQGAEALVENDCGLKLRDFGEAWQAAAEAAFLRSKVYVSGGAYLLPGGKVVLTSIKNPLYAEKEPLSIWIEAAGSIFQSVGQQLDLPIKPVFSETKIHYLRAAGMKNSRGS